MTTLAEISDSVCHCVSETATLLRIVASGDDAAVAQMVGQSMRRLDQWLRQAACHLHDHGGRAFIGLYDSRLLSMGDILAPSYHRLGFEVAYSVFLHCFLAADVVHYGEHKPEGARQFSLVEHTLDANVIVDHWPAVREFLKYEAPVFDPQQLVAMIRDELARAERTAQHKPSDRHGAYASGCLTQLTRCPLQEGRG